MAGSVVNQHSNETVNALAKRIDCEVCSNSSDTVFQKDCDGFEFSWGKLWDAIEQ